MITEDTVYRLDTGGPKEFKTLVNWQNELAELDGFNPVVIGGPIEAVDPLNPDKTMMVDSIGIVTVHDGPSLPPGEIIAPAVGTDRNDKNFHNNYQDPEAFLLAGGRRGLQYVPLTDGTYFINRWFATIESIPKTIVPIGYVGVVVSYYGRTGQRRLGPGASATASASPRASAACWRSRSGRASMPSTPTPATSSWCRRPTSCCTGSPAGPRRTATTRACGRSTW